MKYPWHCAGWLACTAPLLSGCASLDPAEDIHEPSTLVTERAQLDTGWTAPWDEPAAQWNGGSALSSDTAVCVALQNNRAIRREVESIVTARADFVQVHLLPNPVINIAIGFPTDGRGGEPLAAAVVQQLAWLWRRPATIDAAEAELRARVLAVSDAALRLVADVRRGHAALVFAQKAAALQQENVSLLDDSTRLLRNRFDVGEASRLDLNRVELDRRAAEVRLVDRGARLAQAKRVLLELLGRADANTEWDADGQVPGDVDATLDETSVMELAARQRLDVVAAVAVVEARTAGVNRHDRSRLPDVGGGVGYRQNFANRPGVFPAVSITPKLFDDNGTQVARAESELRQAIIEADRVRQAAVAEARQAWVALRAHQDVILAYENGILALAQSNLGLAHDAFDAGETDLSVLLEAQRQLNDARIELTDRQFAAAGLSIELTRAAGGSLDLNLSPATDAGEATR